MTRSRRVTNADVARRAGVSTMTVSRVVNDNGRVSEATRQRVRRAIAELGYQPNQLARSLTQGRGVFSMEFNRYDELPPNIAQKVIAQHVAY